MKCPELLCGILLSLLIFGPPLVVGYIIGRQDGKLSERKAILERWEEIKELRRQDSIKQQRNNKAMKQRIQVTGKNLNELFVLPCVFQIQKGFIMGEQGDPIPSQNIEDCTIGIVHKPLECMAETRAKMGDWLVEDDNGNWHVEKGGEQ